jgi:hypothetical protein
VTFKRAPIGWPHRVEGEREWGCAGAGWCRQAGPACQGGSGHARGLGRAGSAGLKMVLPFSFEFLIPFSFYFLYGIQIKSNHNSNSNISNMCINQKQSLSSA